VHFEYGSSDSDFAIKLTARNCRIVRFRHGDYLARREPPDLRHALRARYARLPRLRVLFIDDRIPHCDQGSGYPRANAMVNAMMRIGAGVTLFPMTRVQEQWHEVYRDLHHGIEVMADASADSLAAFLDERREEYDVIFVSRPHNMRYLVDVLAGAGLPGTCRLIYDAEAVFALRTQERSRILGEAESEAAREMAEEMVLATKADDVVCVSEIERQHFVEHDLQSVYVLGHRFDAQPTANSFEERRDILFVGAMNSSGSPNEDSVRWFSGSVLPIISARLASENIRLVVVGQNTVERLSSLTHQPPVEVVGSVEDLSPYYERARIFVGPTRFGAGIPIKLLEAAARGVPIVATSLMAAQLGWVEGEHLLAAQATDPEEFADQCVRLYSGKELWLRLREAALRRAQADCSPARFEQNLRMILGLRAVNTWTALLESGASIPNPVAVRPS
jgi:glycosyltransferase involved in cell wall biosynthesis